MAKELIKSDNDWISHFLVVGSWKNSLFMRDKPEMVYLITSESTLYLIFSQIKKNDGTVPPMKQFGTRDQAIKEFRNNKGYKGAAIAELHTTVPEIITLRD